VASAEAKSLAAGFFDILKGAQEGPGSEASKATLLGVVGLEPAASARFQTKKVENVADKLAKALKAHPQCAELLKLGGSDGAEDESEEGEGGKGGEGDGCTDPTCSGHGACIDGNDCKCENGFGGETCAEMICPRACSGHGACLKHGVCKCDDHFAGVGCNKKTCADGCSGHGKCVETQCKCDAMWAGELCAFRVCPGDSEECTGHGECNDGVCECTGQWYGEKCDMVECPKALNLTCAGHGLCQLDAEKTSPKCVCIGHWPRPFQDQPMWEGDDCNTKKCADPNCGDRGTCKDGHCACKEGYAGEGCQNESEAGSEGGSNGSVNCKKDEECNGGKCFKEHCYCKGTNGQWGEYCHRRIKEIRDF